MIISHFYNLFFPREPPVSVDLLEPAALRGPTVTLVVLESLVCLVPGWVCVVTAVCFHSSSHLLAVVHSYDGSEA